MPTRSPTKTVQNTGRPQRSNPRVASSDAVLVGKPAKAARRVIARKDSKWKTAARRIATAVIDFRYHDSFEQMRECELSEIVPPLDIGDADDERRAGDSREPRSLLPPSIVRFCRAPLLTPEQERECFRLMNFLKYRANLLREKLDLHRPRPRDVTEIERLLARARDVRDRIVQCNLRLVISVARRFLNSLLSLDDLLSSGSSILLGAAEKFDFGKGFRFSTYAQHSLQREFYRLAMVRRRDGDRYRTGGDQTFGSQSQRSHEPRLSDLHFGDVARLIQCMGQTLDARERHILHARFGLDDSRQGKTLSEVALELGMSKERVRQLQAQAVGKVREVVLQRNLFAELREELELRPERP